MQIETLSFYNKSQFNKLFGIYVKNRREQLSLTKLELSEKINLDVISINSIESGRKKLNQQLFQNLISALTLDESNIQEIAKITEVQYLLGIYKVCDVCNS